MGSPEPRYVDVYVEASELCPEGCVMRWKAEDAPRAVARVRYTDDFGQTRLCGVFGRAISDGGGERSVRAMAVTVEDSGSGTAILIYGGDLGLEILPEDGSPRTGQPYLMLCSEDVIE
jgi:hypothetical protein